MTLWLKQCRKPISATAAHGPTEMQLWLQACLLLMLDGELIRSRRVAKRDLGISLFSSRSVQPSFFRQKPSSRRICQHEGPSSQALSVSPSKAEWASWCRMCQRKTVFASPLMMCSLCKRGAAPSASSCANAWLQHCRGVVL